MNGTILSTVHESRRKPLARCVASIFALAAPATAFADSWVVDSCDETSHSTPGVNHGTLRYALGNATSPATLDLTSLTACPSSKISLLTGQLATGIQTLTINGPGSNVLTIDASGLSVGAPPVYGDYRVLAHYAAGKLTIQNLGLANGHATHYYIYTTYGGCLYSGGDVELDNVTVSGCYTNRLGSLKAALGGGVFTKGALTLSNSTVSYSSVTGAGTTAGGGVYAKGDLSLQKSTISHNTAKGPAVRGGGAYAFGNMTVTNGATIANNDASAGVGDALGGGAFVHGDVTLNNGTGKYFNFIDDNSASSDSGSAKGGGAYAYGNFSGGTHSEILYNSATSTSGAAAGGGLYTRGGFSLVAGNLAHNTVNGGFTSYGGGANVRGNSSISYTTVKYNRAYGNAIGGGLRLTGATNTISSSTINNNISDLNIGGVCALGIGSGVTFELKNSTISSNSAGSLVGGLYVDSANVKLWNSTIAFNTSGLVGSGHSPGAELSANSNAMGASLQSTLISNNSVGSYQLDLNTFPTASSVTINGGLAVPANNLIRATLVTNLPADTKHDCPHLGALRDNGGLTFTHALMSHSAAIDTGNDSSLLALYDQRGSAAVNGVADYTRFSGLTQQADIGAYEVQQNDIVFDTDFEDCEVVVF